MASIDSNQLASLIRSTLVWTLRDAEVAGYFKAAMDTAEYIEQHMLTADKFRGDRDPRNRGRFELLEFALSKIEMKSGLVMQFGVFKGETLSVIADHVDSTAYGFDSFEGLPEAWFLEHGEGEFNLGGAVPKIPSKRGNIKLVKGWFSDTVPPFAASNAEPIRFLHIDCDLYSSTKSVFDSLGDRIVPGTIIVFDEYFNYPGWRQHEYKAFQEFVQAHGIAYTYIGYAPRHYSVALKVTERGR
ncbi:TylF/MycF/NovP-related O-methyltransferase [Dongia sedimenti]|uniref:TylF/MycF/NovP-related O-methyltransferase n=1 Tax=Dongia sedimenti TaxID=3064282 RepID=A0ABU0YHG1_9PROT|nr:TylF/MycF/NovP-related O-methyltransferase [Rhodospirillaceae bacterium R-7]